MRGFLSVGMVTETAERVQAKRRGYALMCKENVVEIEKQRKDKAMEWLRRPPYYGAIKNEKNS